jgi:hypothetical protein
MNEIYYIAINRYDRVVGRGITKTSALENARANWNNAGDYLVLPCDESLYNRVLQKGDYFWAEYCDWDANDWIYNEHTAF